MDHFWCAPSLAFVDCCDLPSVGASSVPLGCADYAPTSRTNGSCRCGEKAQHVSRHHQAAVRAAGGCSVPVLGCLNAFGLWLTFHLGIFASSNSIRPFCASAAPEKLISADSGLNSRADQIEKVRLCVWYTKVPARWTD